MVEGLSKKEKGLMDMDNSVLVAGGKRGIRRLNGNGKKIIKIKLKKIQTLSPYSSSP